MSSGVWSSSDLPVAGFGKTSWAKAVVLLTPRFRRDMSFSMCARGLAVAAVGMALSTTLLAQGTLPPPGISLSGPDGSTSNVTVKQGEVGTVTFTITPSGGFIGIVDMGPRMISRPAGSRLGPMLDFGPTSQLRITGTQPVTAILKIYADGGGWGTPGWSYLHSSSSTYLGAALASIVLVVPYRRRRTWLMKLLIVTVFALLAGGMVACGGSREKVGRGNYVIGVEATGFPCPSSSESCLPATKDTFAENIINLTVL